MLKIAKYLKIEADIGMSQYVMLTSTKHHQNAVKASVEGINRVNMDSDELTDQVLEIENIFKDTYTAFTFSKLSNRI